MLLIILEYVSSAICKDYINYLSQVILKFDSIKLRIFKFLFLFICAVKIENMTISVVFSLIMRLKAFY